MDRLVESFDTRRKKEIERQISSVNSAPTLIMLIRQFSDQVQVPRDIKFNETFPEGNVIKKALENHIIMKQIVDFLNVGDFCRWYDSCEMFQDIIDNMDKSIWRGLANTLMLAIGNKKYLDEKFQDKSSSETFLILRKCIENRSKMLKDLFWISSEHWSNRNPNINEISEASILAHHGLLDSVKYLKLVDLDLASVPTKYLGSLVSCVTENIAFDYVENIDLSSILDKVKCVRKLTICGQHLGTKEIQALLKVMKTRVKDIELFNYKKNSVDFETLTKYDGKGECESVYLDGGFYTLDNVNSWSKQIKWTVERPYSWNKDAIVLKRR